MLKSLKRQEREEDEEFEDSKKPTEFFLEEIPTLNLSYKIGNAIKQEIEYENSTSSVEKLS